MTSGRKAARFYPRRGLALVAAPGGRRAAGSGGTAPDVYWPLLAPVEGHPSDRLGPRRGGGRRALSLRRRLTLPPAARARHAAASPRSRCASPCRRSRARDVAVCALNMWAYLAAYEMPHDDPERLAARAPRRLPDRGRPAARARRAADAAPPARVLRPGRDQPLRAGAGVVPLDLVLRPARSASATCCCATPERFPAAAARMYAVFDIGARVLLGDPDRAAVVGGRSTGELEDGDAGRGAADDDRVRPGVLG